METKDNDFIFHNIGQGLFYSGKIGNFNFVYDCGTESKKNILENSIKSYYSSPNNSQIKTYDKKHIDLLILSHFHNDHINGLNKLLDKFIVKEVIIPYYTPNERFLMAIENIHSERDNDEDNEDIIKFVLSPIEYLINKGIKTVTLIVPKSQNEDNTNKGYKNDRPSYEADNVEGEIKLVFKLKNADFSKYDELKVYNKYIVERKINVYEHDGSVELNNLWEFRFFCHDYGNNKEVNDFNRKIKTLLKGKKLIDAIEDEELRIKIKDKYERLTLEIKKGKRPKLNLTSLIVFHRPLKKDFQYLNVKKYSKNISRNNEYNLFQEMDIGNGKDFFIRITKEIDLEELKAIMSIMRYNTRPFGQLLLSDAELHSDLNTPNNFYRHFKKHFSNIFNDVTITLIPHHGSEKNWNNELLTLSKNCFFWVPSYGLYNRYGHPSGKVLSKIINYNRLILPCNEDTSIQLSFK